MFIMTEMALQTAIRTGIEFLKGNESKFKSIFSILAEQEFSNFYGEDYIDGIWTWFSETKLPVMQAYSFDVTKIPCYSVHLASENEDESKAAMADYFGGAEDNEVGIAVNNVMLDINIHGNRGKDEVIWLYYILNYILFKQKPLLIKMGLNLSTYSASDYTKNPQYMTENVWTRSVRFKCVTQNFFDMSDFTEIDDIDTFVQYDDVDEANNLVPNTIPERFGE